MENGAQANVVALPHGNPPLSKCNSQSPSGSYDVWTRMMLYGHTSASYGFLID